MDQTTAMVDPDVPLLRAPESDPAPPPDPAPAPPPKESSPGEWVGIEAIHPWPGNPRVNEQSVDKVARSIQRWGWGAPILARLANGEIIAGHTRYKAARKLGLARVCVRFLDLSEDQAHQLAIADNRLGEDAEWAKKDLAKLLEDIEKDDPHAIGDIGFNDEELADLAAELVDLEDGAGGDPDDVPEPPESTITKTGDYWFLGEHRLLCGDSTEENAVARLMAGEHADLIWTDPPYGVSYVGKTAEAMTIQNDGSAGLGVLLAGAFKAVTPHVKPGRPFYVAAPSGPLSWDFYMEIQRVWDLRQILMWAKDSMVLGHSDYHCKHEMIFYGYTRGGEGRRGRGGECWHGDNAQTSVFEVPRPKRSDKHPTTKPTDLIAIAMRNSSRRGEIVVDLFGGSGSTLICASQEGRRARLMEIDPRYCDVIVRRWEEFTGKKAYRLGETPTHTEDPIDPEGDADGSDEDPEEPHGDQAEEGSVEE